MYPVHGDAGFVIGVNHQHGDRLSNTNANSNIDGNPRKPVVGCRIHTESRLRAGHHPVGGWARTRSRRLRLGQRTDRN
jgi:hypothetical protein